MLPDRPPRLSWRRRHEPPHPGAPSGWYRDRTNRRFLRHWNGRSWGSRVRPVPSWAPDPGPVGATYRLARARARARRRTAATFAFGAVLAFVAALAALTTVATLDDLPDAPRVADARFLDAAGELCVEAARDVGAIDQPGRTDGADDKALFVERVVARYEELIGDLSVLEVGEASRDAVEEWLTTFSAYTVAGRQYATALRRNGDGATADAVRARGDDEKRELFAFAFENGLPQACVPD